MKKLYRQHRGSLASSLSTTIEVNSLKDILDYENGLVEKTFGFKNYYSNISTEFVSQRCGDYWEGTYYVLVDFMDKKQQCIGMCNFKD